MRVIAGLYRSRPLLAPPGRHTRPTSDRLRETLFNILAPRIPGARFADLYAGTGAVGIEALSRGAAHVLFAERAAPALTALRANLRSLSITSAYTLEPRGSTATLNRQLDRPLDRLPDRSLDRPPAAPALNPQHTAAPADVPQNRAQPRDLPPNLAFDLVFLDPPYEAAAEYAATLALLGSARARPLLAPTALVIAEHSSKLPLPPGFGRLHQTRTLQQGDAALTFYQPESSPPDPESHLI